MPSEALSVSEPMPETSVSADPNQIVFNAGQDNIADALKCLRERGYAIIRGAFDPDSFDKVEKRIEELLAAPPPGVLRAVAEAALGRHAVPRQHLRERQEAYHAEAAFLLEVRERRGHDVASFALVTFRRSILCVIVGFLGRFGSD